MEWFYTLAGLLVGFLVGLTGVGGGSLMTPLLIFVFAIPPLKAVGTDLLFAAITKANGVWVHNRRGTICWRIVGLLSLGSLPAALLTLQLLGRLNTANSQIDIMVTTALGVALILTSLALLFKGRLQAMGAQAKGQWPWLSRWRAAATVITGAVLGVLVTVSSVGAGALGTAAIFFLYPRLRTIQVVGTDVAHAVPLTAVAGLGHLQMLGSVDLVLLGSLLLGSLPGIYLGSHLGANVPERVMRPILASMLMLIGVKSIW